MTIDTKHPDYLARVDQWKRCRDVVEGLDAVHGIQDYLPKLSGQTDLEYAAMCSRAGFYGATGRTLEGFGGMLFRKEPTVKVPDAIKDVITDIDLQGTPIDTFLETLADEIFTVSRAGVLVDYSAGVLPGMSVAEAQRRGTRAYWSMYTAESIINWKEGTHPVTGRHVLTMVVLEEQHKDPVKSDAYKTEYQTVWRVLDLVPFDGTLAYRSRLIRKPANGEQVAPDPKGDLGGGVLVSESYPQRNGQTMDFIPMELFGPKGRRISPAKPLLLDLVNANLDHYRLSADWRHGLHFTALPTAYICGYQQKPEGFDGDNVQSKDQAFRIGSTVAWTFPTADTQVGFLEFTGQGLSAVKDAISDKVSEMATLGARMLAPEKKQTEAAQTAQIHRAGESSVLAGVANSIGRTARACMVTLAEWMGQTNVTEDAIDIRLNKEFYPEGMDPQFLAGLLAAVQSGRISYETFFYNLERYQVIPDGITIEEERARLEKAETIPPIVPAGTRPIGAGDGTE